MYKLLVTLAILALVCGQTKLTSSGTWTSIVTPASSKAVYVDKLNAEYPDIIPGVKWIWDNNGVNTPKGDSIKVKYVFWSKCGSPAVLTFAAYGKWAVYLDGKLVKNGINWDQEANKINWAPKCGKH